MTEHEYEEDIALKRTREQMAKVRAMEAFGFKLRWINHYHCEVLQQEVARKGAG